MPERAHGLPAAAQRIEALLAGFRPQLGDDYAGYGNHVRRVFGLIRAQHAGLDDVALEQAAIAAVFHDLGIWLDGTFDYLEPSRQHAAEYLEAEGLSAWTPLVGRMIVEHHRLRPVRDAPLVEAMRRADLCDVSLGVVRRGIPAGTWAALKAEFPLHGFHRRLVQLTFAQARREPLRPLPMLRW